MKKLLLLIVLLFTFNTPAVFAQGGFLLPVTQKSLEDCSKTLVDFEKAELTRQDWFASSDANTRSELLACAIKTGQPSLSMLPYFISYFADFMLGLISLVALLFVVIGGLQYVVAPYTQAKDKGKAYIRNALIGMGIAFMSWSIVSAILYIFT